MFDYCGSTDVTFSTGDIALLFGDLLVKSSTTSMTVENLVTSPTIFSPTTTTKAVLGKAEDSNNAAVSVDVGIGVGVGAGVIFIVVIVVVVLSIRRRVRRSTHFEMATRI